MTTSNNSGKNDPRRAGAEDDFFDDTHSDIDVPVYRREANPDDKTRPVSVYDRLKGAKDKLKSQDQAQGSGETKLEESIAKKAVEKPESPEESVEDKTADNLDDTTEVFRPKRDIYAMTGRARPQKIEARRSEPEEDSRQEASREISQDEDKTQVIKTVAGGSEARGVEQKDAERKDTADKDAVRKDTVYKDGEKKPSTIPAVGAAGTVGAAAAAVAKKGDKSEAHAAQDEEKPVTAHSPAPQESQSAPPATERPAAKNNQPLRKNEAKESVGADTDAQTTAFASPVAAASATDQREDTNTSAFAAPGAGVAGAGMGAAAGYVAGNRGEQAAQQENQQVYNNSDYSNTQTLNTQGYDYPDNAAYGSAPVPQANQPVEEDRQAPVEETVPQSVREKRGTLGFGILLLRLVAGGFFLVTGLQYLFGLGEESGLSALEGMLSNYSYTDMLAVGLAVAALVGGALLIVGLLTPLGAALGTVAAGFLALHFFKESSTGLWPTTMDPQFVLWALLTVISLAIIFTGSGRAALDRSRGWATRPLASAWIFAVVAIGGLGALWYSTGGGNPLG
ncbi:DoxX [Corynebacterium urogenitale]|uniref:DoxX n=1 Tax=Corynebacterium urogenitale TaxID=2487892 RepID=A0A5J6ZCR4_9CORY|nr:DoxX family protein [Corynebacterium urogenitale]QFQ02660.1 DoxX [Corynebacterium urogenitale]